MIKRGHTTCTGIHVVGSKVTFVCRMLFLSFDAHMSVAFYFHLLMFTTYSGDCISLWSTHLRFLHQGKRQTPVSFRCVLVSWDRHESSCDKMCFHDERKCLCLCLWIAQISLLVGSRIFVGSIITDIGLKVFGLDVQGTSVLLGFLFLANFMQNAAGLARKRYH